MAKINQYPIERLTFGDEDFYDIDYWDGSTYQTAKIKGSTIKAGIQAGITSQNIYTDNGILTADRTLDGANFELFFQEIGKFIVHSHKNNTDNVIFEVRTQTGFESFTIRDHNTGDHLFCIENGKVEINNAYYLPNTDGTAGQVMKTDGSGNATWEDESTGGGGILGISDASGNYTYYSTFALALASASAGDTIEMFADIEETTATTVTLIPDITINGNGHIYKLSVDADTDAITFNSNGTVYLNNITVIRTGRAINSLGYCLQHNVFSAIVKGNGCELINDYGSGATGRGSLYGLNIKAILRGIYTTNSINVYDCNIECSGTSNGAGIQVGGGDIVNCSVTILNGNAISNGAGKIYNSVGITTNGFGISCNGEVYDSIGKSTSSTGMSAQRATNCVGTSTSGVGINASSSGRNCVGISTSGAGGTGEFHNSTLISSSNYGFNGTGSKSLHNCYVESTSNIATFRPNLYNCTVVCKWDNSGGHCTNSNVLLNLEIVNSSFKVTNASAYCLNAYGGGVTFSTWKYANNTFEGSTIPITPFLLQGITNTSDSQGNILI